MPKCKTVVLVVDDDPAVCHALKFALELDGLIVHTYGSGAELLKHSELSRANCIILDLKMPGMDGFQVLERLAEYRVQVPVILIASSVTNRIRERATDAGVGDVIEKPLLDSALIKRIREIA
jgi:two-component system response regulator FixJ